jgi:hypothetical protein
MDYCRAENEWTALSSREIQLPVSRAAGPRWRAIGYFYGPLCLCLALFPLLRLPVGLAADVLDPNATEQAKSILADQIRDQGNACVRAEDAHRDEALSKPDEPVWILKCSNAVYRIRMRGGMAAEVEVLDSYQ